MRCTTQIHKHAPYICTSTRNSVSCLVILYSILSTTIRTHRLRPHSEIIGRQNDDDMLYVGYDDDKTRPHFSTVAFILYSDADGWLIGT